MSALEKPDPQSDTDRLDAAADQAIAMADGNMRSAIRSLILANEYLEMELSDVYAAVSKGYTRGEVWRDPPKVDEDQAEAEIDLDNIPDWYD